MAMLAQSNLTKPTNLTNLPEDRYPRSIALLEDDEEKLWRAVRAIEPDDAGPGARSLRARHSAALRDIFREHTVRIYDVAERGSFAPPRPACKGFTVYSDRKKKGQVETWEANLLPGMGYETREDAERFAWNMSKANPKLKVEVRE